VKLAKNFDSEEFACPCGCGESDIHPLVVERAQKLRNAIGVPITIVRKPYEKNGSGVRCHKHNREIHGDRNSFHLCGMAIDAHFPDYMDLLSVAKIAMEIGFTDIIIYDTFIHLGIGTTRFKDKRTLVAETKDSTGV